jgi:hypothetical protein
VLRPYSQKEANVLDRLLTPEEVNALRDNVKELKTRRASLVEDLEAGLPVQPQIDAIDSGIRTAEHMIKKYGSVAPVRPRKR